MRPCFSIAADLHPVVGDEAQIRQVLHNILLNAVQAMPGGGCVHIKAVNHHPEQPADIAGMPPAGKDYSRLPSRMMAPAFRQSIWIRSLTRFLLAGLKGAGSA